LENYQHKFFGNRFSVNGDKGTLYAEIRQYDGVYSSYKSLKQVDISGKRWLEDLNHQDYYLWDFEKTIRIKIDIDLYPYLLNNAIYADPNDQGFCYLSKDEVWKYFSFENRQSKKIKKPEEDDLIYLGESNWLRIEEKSEQNISTVTIGVSKGDEALSSIDYELEFQDESNFKLLGATVDRSSVLISTHSNLYLIKRGPGEQQVQKVIWPGFDKGDSYQFTSNGSMINCIKTNYAADQNTTTDAGYWVINYNIGKAMLDSIFYKEVELTDYTGFNNFGGSVRWINTKNPIAKEEGFLTNESEKRSKIKPVSFNNTYVKVLLNEQATNEEILKNIDQFFSTATENDEVILFFAGHGMLDSMLNFYFAAHDMDFTQPDKKGIGYQVILDKLGQLPMSRKLVLLDACHSGNLFSPVFNEQKDSMGDYAKGRGAETETLEDNNLNLTDHLSEVYDLLFGSQTDKYGVNVIAASSGANLAYESGELSNGAFTGAYIESILSNFRSNFSSSIDSELVSPVPLTNETLYYFRKKVLDDTNGLQSPSVRSINNTVRILLF
jgi:hypothetical protein